MADFHAVGKVDDSIDEFIILVIDGSSISRFCFKSDVGIGSRMQHLLFVVSMAFLTSSSVTHLNWHRGAILTDSSG